MKEVPLGLRLVPLCPPLIPSDASVEPQGSQKPSLGTTGLAIL